MAGQAGRSYLAWIMLAKATHEDSRRENYAFQTAMRNEFLNHSISDAQFIKLYRLNKEAFQYLCQQLKANTDLKASQRVSLEHKVLCALLFYAHGDYQKIVGEANHFSQEAISTYIQEVTVALNHPNIVNSFIKFPLTREERNEVQRSFYNKYKIPGVIGCIDCSHFKIFTPNKQEEHLYYCRKNYHSLNVQMISDSQCRILSVNAKFGGATHDAFIWENSIVNNHIQSLHRCNDIVWLLGDSGYPQRPWLMTPYTDPTQNSNEEAYNKVHGSARVLIENTFGRLKNRWRCVHRDRTLHYSPTKCAQIIMACCVLHNIALMYRVPEPTPNVVTSNNSDQDTFRHEVEDDANVLLRGRALRDQLASRLAAI